MEKICVICGKHFNADRHSKMCCSSKCAQIKARQTRWKDYVPKTKRERVIYQRECLWCGTPFETPYPKHKYCTPECTHNGNLRLKREQWAEQYVPRTHICKECKTEFTTECGNKHSVFCCQACAEKYDRRQEHQSDRHKAYMKEAKRRREKQLRQQYTEPVSYDALYRRDHGVCQICGMAVHPDKFCDDSWGGTIDHIVPLSVGGKHSMSNCQLAHRICNSLKGTSDDGFGIDWLEKSTENNYWSIKFNSYLELMRQESA